MSYSTVTISVVVIDKEDMTQNSSAEVCYVSENRDWIGHRERKVADLAHRKWVRAGRPPGAWKLFWYEARVEIED